MIYFIVAFIISILFTICVRSFALRKNIVDTPDNNRKKHSRPVPLLGGVAIFVSFWSIVGYLVYFNPIYGIDILSSKLLWIFIASCILLIVGIWDDLKNISPGWRFLITSLAAFVTAVGGMGIEKINSPFGGIINLGNFSFTLSSLGTILVLADLIVFLWLMGMMYTTKILDGLDGLSAGVVLIGAIMIILLSSSVKYYQPNVALLAAVFAGAILGFLIFNFHPAKIFLGESGSLLIGFLLGVLSVIAGSKLAITLLVMAIPIFDLLRVIYVRFIRGQSIAVGDREHLHFRLLDSGLSHRIVVFFYYLLSILFGVIALLFQSGIKFYVLFFIALITIGIALFNHKILKYDRLSKN